MLFPIFLEIDFSEINTVSKFGVFGFNYEVEAMKKICCFKFLVYLTQLYSILL